jgi:hypothetical protein
MMYRTKELAVLGSSYIRHARVCTRLAIITNERTSPKVIGEKKGKGSATTCSSYPSPDSKSKLQPRIDRINPISVLQLQINPSMSSQSKRKACDRYCNHRLSVVSKGISIQRQLAPASNPHLTSPPPNPKATADHPTQQPASKTSTPSPAPPTTQCSQPTP